MDPTGRAAVLEEVRGHLEERVAHLMADGAERSAAEEQAVREFGAAGGVGARLSAAHASAWREVLRVAGRVGLGFVAAPVVWLLCAFPVVVLAAFMQHSIVPGNGDLPTDLLYALAPQRGTDVSAISFGGWPQLAALALLYGALPFWWGRRARRWWAPGLAFGAGAVVYFAQDVVPTWFIDPPFLPQGRPYLGMSIFTFALLPVTVAASGLGYRSQAIGPARPATRRRPLRAAVLLPLVVLIMLALDAATFVSIRAVVSQPPVSLAQRLAQAQQHLSFPIRQPQQLPPSMPLSYVLYHPFYDFNYGYNGEQWVWLNYGQGSAGIFVSESNRPEVTATLYTDGTGVPAVLEATVSTIALGSGSAVLVLPNPQKLDRNSVFRQVNLFWQRDGVYYQVASSGLNTQDLEAIAASIA